MKYENKIIKINLLIIILFYKSRREYKYILFICVAYLPKAKLPLLTKPHPCMLENRVYASMLFPLRLTISQYFDTLIKISIKKR